MRILVLGGTSFVGRAVVERALAGGHDADPVQPRPHGRRAVPGRRAAHRRPGHRRLRRPWPAARWDAVVDVSAYVPRHVQQAADALRDSRRALPVHLHRLGVRRASRRRAADLSEDSPRLAPERGTEEVTGDTYGPLKVACEDDVAALWGDRGDGRAARHRRRARTTRPTGSPTGCGGPPAAGGWPCRAGSSSPCRSSTPATSPTLVVALLEADRPGTYNAVGPAKPVMLGELVQVCAQAAGSDRRPRAGARSSRASRWCWPTRPTDPLFRRSACGGPGRRARRDAARDDRRRRARLGPRARRARAVGGDDARARGRAARG